MAEVIPGPEIIAPTGCGTVDDQFNCRMTVILKANLVNNRNKEPPIDGREIIVYSIMLPRRHNASLVVKREKERSGLTVARPVYRETTAINEELVQPVDSVPPTKRATKVHLKELQLLSLSLIFFFK